MPRDQALIESPIEPLSPTEPRARSLDDVIGLDEVKEELRAQLRLWAYPGSLGAAWRNAAHRVIFCGPTGTGKTTCAHALAAETGRDLYTFSGADFHDEAGRDRLAGVLAAVARKRAVVFVDEADDLLHARDFERENSESLVKFLLVALDRTARDVSSFFIFATNLEPEKIDPALCHPGRLGRPIPFRHLVVDERVSLLRRVAVRYTLASDVRLELLARQLAGVPTASIAYLFDEAAFVSWRSGQDSIRQADLQEAIARLEAGLPRSTRWSAEDLRRAAIHEAGHALLHLVNAGRWEAVTFVQVDPRAEGQAGITRGQEPEEDALSEPRLRQRLMELLGGREAERLLLGSSDTGSRRDLLRANELAEKAASEWGFSRRGPRTFDGYPEAIVESRLDDAALDLLLEAERNVRSVLRAHGGALAVLADRLEVHRSADSIQLREWLEPLLPFLRETA